MLVNVLVALYYLAGIAGITALVTRVVRTRGGPGGPVHDRYEAAFLNGGPARVVDTALTALQADGRLAIGGPGIVAIVRPVAYDPVERAVLQEHAAAPHGALHHLRMAVMRHPAVQEIGDGLAVRGLVVDPATRRTTSRWCGVFAITAFALFPVSIVLTVVDFATTLDTDSGMPVPFIFKVVPILLAALVTAIVCGSLTARQITPAGRRAVFAYGRAHAHLADAGLLVALHGLRALPDPVLREQLAAAARIYGPPRRRGRGGRRHVAQHRYGTSDAGDDFAAATVWCAGTSACGGGGGGGGGGGSCSGGGSGSSCSSGSCSGGGSGCGGGSSCSGSSGSSCSSSSGSSCSSSSSSGSSCSSSSS
ncbi:MULTISPECIES: TIGR04222 domain-containing membrane protein [unclassified Streptomyces]|uniref:TIGR04222 domain-containing membrane protein n=1 Tax=unclassified Streptomyces TaxID=2593676 RepID=UPI001E500393|nr:TIGR04222 domain-containing membrane protein [Streptomyces sp. CB02980]MCB8905824.1 TIGR04222 domain-containing membrane protein [Streptomyces sp. CB02980]